jgi:hypothetical protein
MKVEAKNKRNKILINEKFDSFLGRTDIRWFDFYGLDFYDESGFYCYDYISWTLKFIKKQSNDICLEIVKKDGWALQYVKEQTDPICWAAVRNHSFAIMYVKNQTEEICLAAVKQNGNTLKYVKNQTKAICLEAVKRNSEAFCYVKIKDSE